MGVIGLLAHHAWSPAHDGWWGGGMWVAMVLGPLLVVALLGLLGWAGARALGGRTSTGRAREILDERLARGELSVEEYQERIAALR